MRSVLRWLAVAVSAPLFIITAPSLVAFENTDVASGTRMTSGIMIMDAGIGQQFVGVSGDLVGGFLGIKAAPDFIAGDADGSGAVAISDAVWVINYIFGGGLPPKPIQAGDADCSGSVGIGDAVYIINFIFGGGPSPHYCR